MRARQKLQRAARAALWLEVPGWSCRLLPGPRAFTARELSEISRAARRLVELGGSRLDEGALWYSSALDAVDASASRHGVSRLSAASALAAVSPGMPWERNLDALDAVLEASMHGSSAPVVLADLVSARALPVPFSWRFYLDALDAVLEPRTLSGVKRRAFREGVVTRGETSTVCVDGHAWLAAWSRSSSGSRVGITRAPSLTGRRYDATAAAYVVAALELEVAPASFQASCWLAWRELEVER